MGPIILIIILALLGWLALSAVRSLWARSVGWPWWISLAACLVIGIASGIWFGFFFEYCPSPRLRVMGCPVPVACFALEKGADGEERWTDFVTPVPLLFATSNVVLFSLVSVYPVWVAHSLWRLLRRADGHRGMTVEPEQD
jgi:hypothetical protein